MAHAVLGAVVAQINGHSALAGAAGAAGGELAAQLIANQLYPDTNASDLTETQKQTVTALATVAAGLAGGLAGGDTANAIAGAQAGENAVENNFLAVPVPVPPPAVATGTLAGAANNADDTDMMGGGGCEGTREQCAVRDPSRDGSRGPNVAQNLTDDEKAELGGAGAGTPGGWGPEDEENARDPGQHEQYKDELRQQMEKPTVKDSNLSNIIDDLYRPNAKVGSGSTADAVRHELATGETVGSRGHVEKAQTYSKALQDWLNKNPTASPGDRAAAENVLKDLQNALKGK